MRVLKAIFWGPTHRENTSTTGNGKEKKEKEMEGEEEKQKKKQRSYPKVFLTATLETRHERTRGRAAKPHARLLSSAALA